MTYPSLVSKLPNQSFEFIKLFIHLSSNIITGTSLVTQMVKNLPAMWPKRKQLSDVDVFGGENEI